MSYTPTEWATGDVITADKLNNMEDGIVKAGRVFNVNATVNQDNEATLSKTCGEIKAAIMGGSAVIVGFSATNNGQTIYVQDLIQQCDFNEDGGGTIVFMGEQLNADTDNDYPTNVGDR